jgi:hypothetical protein
MNRPEQTQLTGDPGFRKLTGDNIVQGGNVNSALSIELPQAHKNGACQ